MWIFSQSGIKPVLHTAHSRLKRGERAGGEKGAWTFQSSGVGRKLVSRNESFISLLCCVSLAGIWVHFLPVFLYLQRKTYRNINKYLNMSAQLPCWCSLKFGQFWVGGNTSYFRRVVPTAVHFHKCIGNDWFIFFSHCMVAVCNNYLDITQSNSVYT